MISAHLPALQIILPLIAAPICVLLRPRGLVWPFGVHIWGRASDVEALQSIAERRKLRLLFDAAHAFGCSHGERPVGGFGEAEVFSFHATKFLNTFEGGAVVTNDSTLANATRLMTNFGFCENDHVVSIGTNGKMSEVSAAMGLASLESMAEVLAWNRRNYEQYVAELKGVSGLHLVKYERDERWNFQYIVAEGDEVEAGLDRDVLLEVLHRENVLARRYFYPGVHRMEPYRTTQPDVGARLPHTERLTHRVLVLPTGRALSPPDITRICDLIKFAYANGAEISARLPREKLVVTRDLR